jgi:3-mercaptopyruvate sulfurtransferase SseA
VALQLKRAGVRRVRPLAGGFEAWRKLNYPIEPAILDTAENPVIDVKANVNRGG